MFLKQLLDPFRFAPKTTGAKQQVPICCFMSPYGWVPWDVI